MDNPRQEATRGFPLVQYGGCGAGRDPEGHIQGRQDGFKQVYPYTVERCDLQPYAYAYTI